MTHPRVAPVPDQLEQREAVVAADHSLTVEDAGACA
jgi:hypothetical protein